MDAPRTRMDHARVAVSLMFSNEEAQELLECLREGAAAVRARSEAQAGATQLELISKASLRQAMADRLEAVAQHCAARSRR